MERTAAQARYRVPLFAGAMAVCLLATYRYHFLLQKDVVFSHIYYLPIALAGLWWGLNAIAVALILSLYMMISRLLSDLGSPTGEDLVRCCMFVVVGAAIGLLVRQRDRLQAEAQRERERNFRQMTEHLSYVARVSHELRNPLQIILGVVDSLPRGEAAGDHRRMLEMLDRSAEDIRGRIQELTRGR